MTTTSRLGAAATAAALLCAAPAAANAATLAPTKSCFGSYDVIGLKGTGFTPGAVLAAAANGRPIVVNPPITADAAGIARAVTYAQPTSSAKVLDSYTLTDTGNPALTATTQVRRTRLSVKVRDLNSRSFSGPVRVRAAGFTTGTTLYGHVVRGKRVKTYRVGKLKGACRTGAFRRSFFRSNAALGRYRVQFDTRRRYSRKTLQNVSYTVRLSRRLVRRSAASVAAAGSKLRAEFGQPVTR